MFRAKAKKEEWMQGEMMCGGRPRDYAYDRNQDAGDL